jgi:hypothetical protein
MSNKLDKYKCQICFKQYQDRTGIRRHKLSKKCDVRIENKIEQLVQTALDNKNIENVLEIKNNEIKKLIEEKENESKKVLEQQNEIIRLRTLMESNLKNVQDIKEEIIEKITENNQEIKEKIIESSGGINNNTNYNLTQNNNNKKLNFNIQLAPNEKERFDHIPHAQMLCILDQKDFSNSIADLVQAVSFNPKAPENMTWCINDKQGDQGAIKYNPDLNILIRDSSTDVITKTVQNILFPATDMMKELTKLNTQQNQNCARYFNMLGNDSIKKEYVNSIKERAFSKRGLCKALWEHLEIGLETKKIKR